MPPAAAAAAPVAPPRTAAAPAADVMPFAELLGAGGAASSDDTAAATDDGAADSASPAAADPAPAGAAAADGMRVIDWLLALRQTLLPPATPDTVPVAPPAAPGIATHRAGKAAAIGAAPPETAAAELGAADGSAALATALDGALSAPGEAREADVSFAALPLVVADAAAPVPVPVPSLPPPSTLQGGGATPAAPLPEPATAPPLQLAPDHADFVEGLGERIVWITDGGLQHARIELHPVELGAMSVQVQIRGDEAQIAFSADLPATRALLQNAVPQLRALLDAQGLQLLRARVDARVAAVSESDGTSDAWRDAREPRAAPRRVGRLKLVDAYV
ncbi:flagellar hook-length control protein FliK [Solimonas soli]|uniref:flagellar hook-length control protein FliK n=1 Tax=Solimonas soli TaxID=413479 RepID=UPI001FE1AFBA|nr:flagellar hook-length control protein FliK [Solimonas soli]